MSPSFAISAASTAVVALVLAAVLALAPPALAGGGIIIGHYSQQSGPGRAVIRASVASTRVRAHKNSVSPTAPSPAAEMPRSRPSRVTINVVLMYPSLSKSAPILRQAHPAGAGSFWYSVGAGRRCIYAPASVTPCFTLVGPAGPPAGATLTPVVLATSVAQRLELSPGAIETSPARTGLTGADSWFWLDPAPQRQTLSVSLAGERVSVVADPTVGWRFGDGASLDGGPGVPYQPGTAPVDAIRHVYQARCLPGDQGHDPYVLSSCGRDGYRVGAVVIWRISFSAAGPIAESGTLPVRTTENSASYPVSESRAFLVNGSGQ
jgi:hypothetical protein